MVVSVDFLFFPARDISMETLTPLYVAEWLGNIDSGVVYVGF